jgi:hypothetical protein
MHGTPTSTRSASDTRVGSGAPELSASDEIAGTLGIAKIKRWRLT